MSFTYRFSGPARAYLGRLDARTQRRFADAIKRLAEDPFGPGTKPLKGRESRALRVGGWRVIYRVDVDSQSFTVQVIGTRGQVYRDL